MTPGERIEMIYSSLKESGLDMRKCIVVAIENQFNIATWSSYLKSMLPPFDKVYSGNDYVKMLLSDFKVNVILSVLLDREKFTATTIRSMIIFDENWKKFIPYAVSQYVDRINAKNRLEIIPKSDITPTEY